MKWWYNPKTLHLSLVKGLLSKLQTFKINCGNDLTLLNFKLLMTIVFRKFRQPANAPNSVSGKNLIGFFTTFVFMIFKISWNTIFKPRIRNKTTLQQNMQQLSMQTFEISTDFIASDCYFWHGTSSISDLQ